MFGDALDQNGHRRAEISRVTGISIATLGDLEHQRDEWYSVTSLNKLRVLCRLLNIDFENAFEVPAFDEDFVRIWREKFAQNKERLQQDFYMDKVFLEYLATNISVLNLYPVQLTDDIAREIQVDVGMLLALLARPD